MEEMASSGCLGVAVGVESMDDDNCASMHKDQNLRQPFSDAVRRATERGVQTCALIMVGLPHDTPERLARTLGYLERTRCSLYDVRVLRMYPGTTLYRRALESGDVGESWWLSKETASTCNDLLPSCLSVHFRHESFRPMQLQQAALRLTAELNRMEWESVSRILRVGRRGRGMRAAATILYARQRSATQARALLEQVERAMSADVGRGTVGPAPALSHSHW
jgi:radical SAM superfamily enzyme YgiQ (UPF0313 family)